MGTVSTDRAALIDLLDRANWELYREVARRSGGRIEEADGLVLVAGVHPSPVIVNVSFRIDPRLGPAEVLDRVQVFFDRAGHHASLMTAVHTDADLEAPAEAAGWRRLIELPGMIRYERLADRPMAGDVALRRVHPDWDLAAFRAVVMDGFADDEDEREMIAAAFAWPRSVGGPNTAARRIRRWGGRVGRHGHGVAGRGRRGMDLHGAPLQAPGAR